MKYWYLVAFATLFWACSESNMAGGTSEEAEGIVAIKDREVAGVTQKGPFLVGSSVTIQELDGKTLIQTGRSFKTSVKTNLGDFAVKNVNLASQYALLEVNGYFRNEVTGKNSEGMISLNALTDLTNRNNVNVNVLTHLETDRVLNLVQKQGMSFADAKKQAESEIFSSFGFTNSLKSPEDMNILSGENSDVLFALSVLMLGNGSVADFSERLALVARSFAENGEWRSPEKGEVVDWAYQIESENNEEYVEKSTLSKIWDNVESWNLRDGSPLFFAPYIDGLLYVFWINEYNLGLCDKNHSGEMRKNTNPYSKYYDKEFVCYYNNESRCTDDGIGCRWLLAE